MISPFILQKDYMWSIEGTALELTYNYGTDTDVNFKGYYAGNQEKDGFGHIAFNTDDVYAACEYLESKDVLFKKKPDEGRYVFMYMSSSYIKDKNLHFVLHETFLLLFAILRMKGLAFAYDPDGYWVEIVKRANANKIPNLFNLSQTMLRIKDPAKSIPFYESFGMTLVRSKNYGDFSNYFMVSSNNKDNSDLDGIEHVDDDVMKKERVSMMFPPVLELTHNHGTENDPDFKHFNGNEEGKQGFGHLGFLVDDVYEACDGIRKLGYGFKKVTKYLTPILAKNFENLF